MSGMNYFDEDHVYNDLKKLARKNIGKKVVVNWLSNNAANNVEFTPRVRKSIRHYKQHLPKLAASHKIDLIHLREYRTEIYIAKNHRLYVKAIAIDDNGKEHSCFVWE